MTERRAIVADDDPDIRSLLVIAARRAGFDVVADLGNGTDALAAIEAEEIDVAVLDVSMPGLSGLDIVRRLREEGRPVRVVLVSASVDAAALDAGIRAGADDYVMKPFSPRELAAGLSAASDRWEQEGWAP